MIQRVCVGMILGVLVLPAFAAAADVTIELTVVPDVVNLGEPFDLVIRIENRSDHDLVTFDNALGWSRMWPYLELTHVDEDGLETVIDADLPMSGVASAALWVDRDGEQTAARPALRVAPHEVVEVVLANVLRTFPIAQPGRYRLAMFYELPVFDETFTSLEYGDTELVSLDDVEWLSIVAAETEFSLQLSEGLTGTDLAWFQDARSGMRGVGCGEDAISAFSILPPDANDTIRACSLYWIGEAYQRFERLDDASAAYASVIDEYPETLFASYAARRIGEITSSAGP